MARIRNAFAFFSGGWFSAADFLHGCDFNSATIADQLLSIKIKFLSSLFDGFCLDYCMHCIVGDQTFDNQDFESILRHAKMLERKNLTEIAELVKKPELVRLRGKGAAGQLLHTWFGLDQNDNRAEADLMGVRFPDGRFGDVEVKAVPLMAKSRGYRIKERCKVTNIDYKDLLDETWPSSRARHKLLSVIFIFYRYAGWLDWPVSRVEKVFDWAIERTTVQETIKNDWQRTWNYVDEGRAHEISESQGIILGASTAGQGGESKHVEQPRNPGQSARKRAFALKPAFLQTAYEYAVSPKKFESVATLRGEPLEADLRAEILRRFDPLIGKTLGKIATDLKIPRKMAKQASALLVKRVLGISTDEKRPLELEAAGIKPKTIPVRQHDLRPCEAMSFPAMRLAEFVEEEWKESEFRSHLDCLLLIPTLVNHCDDDLWSRHLGKPFFWSPSKEEEAGIAKEWNQFKQEVIDGKAAYRRIGGRRVSDLTPGSKTTYIHLRPKSRDGSNDDVDPNGKPTQKLCFWLNQSFVQSLLRRHF